MATVEPSEATSNATKARRGRKRRYTFNDNLAKAREQPQELKISDYPSVDEIRNAIPEEGLPLGQLVSKFAKRLDDTNASLFYKLLCLSTVFEEKGWVKATEEAPKKDDIEAIEKEAKKPRDPLPKLRLDQERRITSNLHNFVEITFSEPAELARNASDILPSALYRTFYETSATLCRYVNTHTHAKCRESRELKLEGSNAFQPIGEFDARRDLTTQRVERHLIWNMKREPSSYISAFNDLAYAIPRARWHYHKSQRIGERTSIAKIPIEGLIAASVRGKITVKEEVFKKYKEDGMIVRELESESSKTFDAEIPVWIRSNAKPADGSSITVEELAASGADMWLSVMELRHSDLKSSFSKGHNYEWLCCGPILKSRVEKVMPFDGYTLHRERGSQPVISRDSSHTWIFNWDTWMWDLESDRGYWTKPRSYVNRNTEDEDADDTEPERPPKRQKSNDTDVHNSGKRLKVDCPNCKHHFSI